MAKNRVRTCSSKNCKEKYFAKGFCRRHYRQISEVKAKEKEYSKKRNQMPEVKAKQKASKMTPEYKAQQRAYNHKPEVKAKQKARRATPEFKARDKARRATPEYKAQQKAHKMTPEYKAQQRAYYHKPEVKAKQKARYSRPEIKAEAKARRSTPEYKAKRKSIRYSERLKVLQYYSKRLSKSDIPCCRCCGDNFHIDFLAVDHIAGIKKMDSEPELVKLGYSSSISPTNLMHWIIVNNFPKGFQILCHNCNFAKGIVRNNNKCPHQK